MHHYSNQAYSASNQAGDWEKAGGEGQKPSSMYGYDKPTSRGTTGIGYYGVSRGEKPVPAPRSQSSMTVSSPPSSSLSPVSTYTQSGSKPVPVPRSHVTSPGTLSPGMSRSDQDWYKSPTSVGSRYNSSNKWDYLTADLDLSPRQLPRSSSSQGYGLSGANRMRSPGYESQPSGYDSVSGSLRDPKPGPEVDRSTVSKDSPSDPSSNRSESTPRSTSGNISKDNHNISYRERWQRNRQGSQHSISSALRGRTPTSHPNLASPSANTAVNQSGISHVTSLSRSLQSPISIDRSVNLDTNRSISSPYSDPILGRDYVDMSQNGSLRRDPVTHRIIPTHQQNGTAKAVSEGSVLNQSRRSLTLSRVSLSKGVSRMTLYGKGYGVHNSLVNLAFLAILALVMCILGTQLLFRVSSRMTPGLSDSNSVLQSSGSYDSLAEVVTAMASVTVMLDLCCVLTCTMQGYYAAKLIKCAQGEER